MPPKKGKGKKGGAKKAKAKRVATEGVAQATAEEKEDLLQDELADVNGEIDEVKRDVDNLRKENEWLLSETNRVRLESHEYMAYIEKKTSKRQSYIISLSDYNKNEVERINEQKNKMLAEYEEKKKKLQAILLDKENQLKKKQGELDGLVEYKKLQEEQSERIKSLEREIHKVRREQTQQLQDIKESFTQEKREAQKHSDALIRETVQRSTKEATEQMNDYTGKIKKDNTMLRKELLSLIAQTKLLEAQKTLLQRQHKELLREQQYAADLKAIRTERQKKLVAAKEKFNDPEQAIISTADYYENTGIAGLPEDLDNAYT